MDCCLTEHISSSPEETLSFGETLAGKLKPPLVIALRGGLGAGKTCLTKGIARGLGICENLTSPTYTIVSEYSACLDGQEFPLYHIDAYRLGGDEDFENSGAGEGLRGEGIAIVEWSERIPRSIPPDALTIEIEISGPQSRLFRVRNEPACH
ncbi:MAG: tRNA (adenosine(37)-N6)-threonylcarbamoyltransferase complex ATPase subunit type 1 TsaE [Treponema sp.]|jgi:tRNA threonylcarbamoyladenosine biosynthesis protein TsaE|nr:tRNA (adenosine(37)-N6)-threonylcarbamoyltransferase complex ATPase subunit type 1 TsaE [Treponema sp.]